jgi:uncharacterized protein YjiS (DUF1127 family)
MISFTEKDLDAVAMVAPTAVANNNTVNMDFILAEAHRARSEYAHKIVSNMFSNLKARFVEYQKTQHAIASLQSMSDRELSDLRVTRSNIAHAVKGLDVAQPEKQSSFVAWIERVSAKIAESRMRRLGYHQLMAMDARQLSDIGLTRGDVANVMSGKSALANDNVHAANTNKDVKVS